MTDDMSEELRLWFARWELIKLMRLRKNDLAINAEMRDREAVPPERRVYYDWHWSRATHRLRNTIH
jgi:hypothetical protein